MNRTLVVSSLLLACASAPQPRPPERIDFIEDDYARALAEARATKRPIFVDAWAPW